MVPDDIVKPPHISIEIAKLTPQVLPTDLRDDIYVLITQCAADNSSYDAAEIHECLSTGPCSAKIVQGHQLISLPMVLYVLAEQANTEAYRPGRGR